MFAFATHAPITTERHVVHSSVAALVLTRGNGKGKNRRVVPQPRAIFVRTNGTITVQSARKGETINFPQGTWEAVALDY